MAGAAASDRHGGSRRAERVADQAAACCWSERPGGSAAAARANAIEAMFKAMNDDIRANTHGLSKTNPQQAILNGLLSVTCEEATKLVRQSCLDVYSWL